MRLDMPTSLLLLAVGFSSASHAGAEALPDPLAAGWRGQQVCEQLYEDATIRVLRCTFAPGTGHERHYHAPNFGYVISGGKLRMTDADGTRDQLLHSGTGAFSEGVDWHEGVNVGETTVVYLIVEPKSLLDGEDL